MKAVDMGKMLMKEGSDLGWDASTGDGYHDSMMAFPGEGCWVRLARNGIVLAFNINEIDPRDRWMKLAYRGLDVSAHTSFDGRCFTRFGVDVASCYLRDVASDYAYDSLAALLEGESKRCEAARERAKTAVPVPGLPFTRQPQWFEDAGKRLRAGKRVELHPHGFGMGYSLSKYREGRMSKRALKGLETMLGVQPLWITEFECD